jgi:very-short-patch-repair endonuclease
VAQGVPHIRKLLEASSGASRENGYTVREDLIGPVWEPKMAQAIRDIGLPVLQQYPACGRFLDIALIRQGLKLDIEIDGEQHRDITGRRRLDDLERDETLIAAGWQVQRFWVYQLREDFEGCLRQIRSAWEHTSESSKS